MSKKELTKELMERMQNFGHFPTFTNVKIFIQEYEKLAMPEPQKPVVPQYIADFIEEQKKHGLTLSYSIDASMSDRVAEWYWDNPELFARAWLDGYEVEKEKRYTVKIKGNLGQYLGRYYLNNEELTPQFIRTQQNDPSYFTKAELEQTGFGWVFDCEGIEVEEVE